jgi:two-component system cell cycle sensor histidine kinase/response regulator CckA
MPPDKPVPAARWFTLWVGACFTAVVAASLAFSIRRIDVQAREKGLAEARAIFDLNLAYRRWATGHGGVYVPVRPGVVPNPYLAAYPDRDLKTADGRALTLVNPAMMTRNVHELLSTSAPVPLLNRVTSLDPVNPRNAPDAWERRALQSFERGATEATTVAEVNGAPYLRLLRPYFVELGCLTCHSMQGYKLGDVRGGLSVGVAMRPYLDFAAAEKHAAWLSSALIWAIGVGGILLLGRRIERDGQRLVDGESKFRTLAETSPDWEYWSRPDGSILFMSPSALAITGHGPEEFVRDPALLERIVHPDDLGLWRSHRTAPGERCDPALLFRIVRPDGQVRWLSHTCGPIAFRDEPAGRRVSTRDVTDLEVARGSLQRWGHIFEHADWGVAVGSADGSILEQMNPAFARMHGYAVEELRGRDARLLFAPEALAELPAQLDAAERAGHHAWESVHLRKDGSRFPVQCDMTVVRDGDRIAYRVVHAQDVTERRRIDAQLRQAQKMEAIGQLAGGVAHDFNNVLSVIVGHATLLQDPGADGPSAREHVAEILAASHRAKNLTKSLLSFSRKYSSELELHPVDVNELVRGFQKMLSRIIGEDVTLRTHLADRPLVVDADPGQLEQVLLNLAANARDAMPRGGTLTIASGPLAVEPDSQLPAALRPGPWVLLTVSDTGSGMSREVLEHVFEPFFTTKEVGRGTGLGLSIVYGIVTRHNGTVTAYSEVGHGTVFKIYLPLSERAPAPSVERPAPARRGSETLLLVEDEEAVRHATRLTLERSGYVVVEAKDGVEAVRTLRETPDRFALVLCDLVMPGINGVETAESLHRIRPDLQVLFMSGYTRDLIAEKGLGDDFHFVSKPLIPRELLAKVRELLDARGRVPAPPA